MLLLRRLKSNNRTTVDNRGSSREYLVSPTRMIGLPLYTVYQEGVRYHFRTATYSINAQVKVQPLESQQRG